MRRFLQFSLVMLLVGPPALQAANPDDLEFRARLLKDSSIFHIGEPIQLEYSYSSSSENKYQGSFSGAIPGVAGPVPHLTPQDGVLDLLELRRDVISAVSILSSGGYLNSGLITQQLDLSRWFRFQRAGHYTVILTSKEIWRVKSPDEGGGREPLTLESNAVDFDILPADPAWVAQQLNEIEQALNAAKDAAARDSALYRLALLDTAASVQRMVQLYLTSAASGGDWQVEQDLHESSQIDVIIPLLQNALSDPTARIPSRLPVILADLQTRKELGVVPAYPADPAGRQKWNEISQARAKVHDKYLAQANALLKASMERRTGPQKASAIYQMWYDSTASHATGHGTSEDPAKLERNVLAVADELNHGQQVQFVALAWQDMPHDQLLPLVRNLARYDLAHAPKYTGHDGFRLWCEERLDECSEAILQNVVETKAKTDANLVLMMPEAEHPELDSMLEGQLKDAATLQDGFQSQRTAAVILRAGSRNLAPAVENFLDQSLTSAGCVGQTRGDLLGYLLRVAPEEGRKRLSTDLQTAKDYCGSEVLRTLHQFHPSDDIIPIAVKALNAPNFQVAQSAALYLGEHGQNSVEDALWGRLESLWSAWQGRASELPDDTQSVGPEPRNQAAMLERALASALAHANNWKLSPSETDRLRDGCLTQPCRDIADGKMFMNL